MESDKDEKQIIFDLLEQNRSLLEENNRLLRKTLRRSTWSFIFRLLWLMLFLGVPFALYYYFIEPYFHNVGDSFASLNESLSVIPGWNQFVEAITLGRAGGE